MDMPKFLNGEKVTVVASNREAVIHHATCENGVDWTYFIENSVSEFQPFTEDELKAR